MSNMMVRGIHKPPKKGSDYKEFLGRMATYVAVGIVAAIVAIFLYIWLIYLIATQGVEERIEQDRHNVPENIGG